MSCPLKLTELLHLCAPVLYYITGQLADKLTITASLIIVILVRERSALATLIFTSRVCLSVILSVILSVRNFGAKYLGTRPDSGMVTMDGLYKLAYGLSIGHTPDDVT